MNRLSADEWDALSSAVSQQIWEWQRFGESAIKELTALYAAMEKIRQIAPSSG